MKFLINIGLAICIPFLTFAQEAEKTMFGNITDVYVSYKFSSNFDKMLSNQYGLGIELYENFDLEFVTTNHVINTTGEDIIAFLPPSASKELISKGQSYGLALHYRMFPSKTIRPIIGLGWELGKLKHDIYNRDSQLEYLYARLGVEYKVLDFLVLSGNVNLVSKYAHLDYYGDFLSSKSNNFLNLSARLSFNNIK